MCLQAHERIAIASASAGSVATPLAGALEGEGGNSKQASPRDVRAHGGREPWADYSALENLAKLQQGVVVYNMVGRCCAVALAMMCSFMNSTVELMWF